MAALFSPPAPPTQNTTVYQASADPSLAALNEQASNNNQASIQKAVTNQTDFFARLFGSNANGKAPILGL